MAQVLFVLLLLGYCSGVSSQQPLTQPASMSGSPGQMAKLSCTVTGVTSQPRLIQPAFESVSVGQTAKLSCSRSEDSWNEIAWYQQRYGQAPRFVHYAGGSRGEGIPDRFTASRSGNTGYLTITNIQAEDEADYYCGDQHSSDDMFYCDKLSVSDFLIMDWALLLLPFLTYYSGVNTQAVLTQDPSQSESLGNTARLTCSLSSGHESYVVEWYQQREGQAPRLVLYKDTSRATGIPDRFSGSKSGGQRYLTITGVQAEDEATYYCGESETVGGTSV
ncbi:immunoglobulin lambda-1 light chain-like [Elgaria multicarinata webbii]|uniref:immunoglobulin lambda-1 light chain-like n=1 Tax=Elgaria multicarinata webbii TaxID=159646 RepID=UPI002FCCD124